MTETRTGYLPELDGVRAASILLVIATHLLPVGPSHWELNSATGLMGMSLFFCLSGFLITRFLYESPDIGTFFTRRIARIVPLMAFFSFVVAGLMYQRWDTFQAIMLLYMNYTALGFKGIGHLWSLCVEMHFYIAIGLAIWIFGRRGFWLVPVAAILVMWARVDIGAYKSINTHLRVDEILSGSLLALFWLNLHRPGFERIAQWWGRGFWIFLPLWFLSSHTQLGGDMAYLRPYFAMALVGSILFMPEGFIRQICRLPVLAYIAAISYALYVWHPLTALGWLGEGDKWTLYLIKRPISFVLFFALAHISTFTLERYFTQLARRLTAKKAAAEPTGQ